MVIEFDHVTKSYPGGETGLDDVSFTVRRGEFVFLVGSTGSGKSTLMRLLIKELDPTAGTIRVAGRDLADITRKKVPYYRRNIGVVFQDFKLLPNRTVHDNVAYALQVTGGTRREIRSKVPDILRLTGLSTKLHNYPDQLSGGEQQRVSVARAFVNHPPLLLADEPTGNLDPETSIGIMQLLYRINRTGTTVVVATHDHAMVDRMRRRVIELSAGRLIRDEAAGQYAPRDISTAEFGALMREPAPGAPARRRSPATCSTTVAIYAPLMRVGFFLREALRSMSRNAVPSFAAMASVLVTVLVLGVFIPVVQATTGAANEVRGRVLVNVYLKTNAERADVQRVRRALNEKVDHVGSVEYVSKRQALAEQRKRYPEAYDLLGSNPLPDTFRVTPDKPDNALTLRDALAPVGARRRAHDDRPGDRPGQELARRHAEDPRRHARGEADHGPARRAARHRLGAAHLQHDPPVAVLAPSRGRGDEARRRDRLVHPLAVRDRGDRARRARRGAGDPPARGRQGRPDRSAHRAVLAARRARHDPLRRARRRAADRLGGGQRRRLGPVAAPLPARLTAT